MIHIKIDNVIRIPIKEISNILKNNIKNEFTYSNIEFLKIKNILKNIKNNLYKNYRYINLKRQLEYRLRYISPVIRSYRISKNRKTLIIPRGAIDKIINIFKKFNIKYKIINKTITGKKINYNFKNKILLSLFQKDALKKLLKNDQGLFISPTGSGKTRIMLALICYFKKTTMVIVHTTEALRHWKNEILKTLDNIKKKQIGQLGAGKKIIKPITIAMLQTLWRLDKKEMNAINKYFGIIIISESHHTPPNITYKVINKLKSKYRFGESASKTRKDGKEPLIFDSISHNIIEVYDTEKDISKRILIPKVKFIHLQDFKYDFFNDYAYMITALINNDFRNNKIIEEIFEDVKRNHKILVLSDRVKHCKIIYSKLKNKKINAKLIIGSTDFEKREKIIKNIDKHDVIIATSNLASESINIPILSSLHLVTPSNNFELLKQRTGRIRRVLKNKKSPIIKDYIDINCDYLVNIAKNRYRFYKKLGYSILNFIK